MEVWSSEFGVGVAEKFSLQYNSENAATLFHLSVEFFFTIFGLFCLGDGLCMESWWPDGIDSV